MCQTGDANPRTCHNERQTPLDFPNVAQASCQWSRSRVPINFRSFSCRGRLGTKRDGRKEVFGPTDMSAEASAKADTQCCRQFRATLLFWDFMVNHNRREVAVIDMAWLREGGTFTFSGDHYRLIRGATSSRKFVLEMDDGDVSRPSQCLATAGHSLVRLRRLCAETGNALHPAFHAGM